MIASNNKELCSVSTLRKTAMRPDCPLSYGQLYRMEKAGQLKDCSFKVGNRTMINWNRFVEYLNCIDY